MDTPQEQELLLSAQNGDNNAFEQLLKINFNKSKNIIQKHFNIPKHNMDDIMQNTSVKIWQHFKEYSNYDNFYNWFFTVFKNESVRFLKQRNRIESNEVNSIMLSNEDNDYSDKMDVKSLDFILQDTARTFLEKKEQIKEYQSMINDLFAKLSNNHKEIVQYILIDGKSYKETSKLLNIPVGSVMSRLYYAKKESQKIINEYSKSNDIELNALG